MILRKADEVRILPQADGDVYLQQELREDILHLTLTAGTTPVQTLCLRWYFQEEDRFNEPFRVLGDAWERSYGDLAWREMEEERMMPWLCAVSNGSDSTRDTSGRWTQCYGVKTQPNAFCMWQLSADAMTLWVDVRNGGEGVLLHGRMLHVCDVVFAEYRETSAFDALCQFQKVLCEKPLAMPKPVYGSNNWYYAYGQSSKKEILEDTALVSRLCAGAVCSPFMVIDDGWQRNATDGPWDVGNDRFPDMQRLADNIKKAGVRPGLWVRYLSDAHRETEAITEEMRSMRNVDFLDPSHPDVLEKVARDTRRFTYEWGYELIKHDFSTFDCFGFWGNQRKAFLAEDGWHFYDRTQTSAEILLKFYRTIYENIPEGTVLLGCNVIGHLAAGLVHLNRTGDDTSGVEWERTRKMGVNTLAFRLPQHRAYFDIDADCVGITGKIPWTLNRQWLRLLACSGTPLFVSCKPDACHGVVEEDLKEAFLRGSRQEDQLIPLDWMENPCPKRWLLNGEEIHFDW